MRAVFPILLLVICGSAIAGAEVELISGDARMIFPQGQSLEIRQGARAIDTLAPGKPLTIEVNGKRLDGTYSSTSPIDNEVVCSGRITTPNGTIFQVTDRFRVIGNGTFGLRRKVEITNANQEDRFFNTTFGLRIDPGEDLARHEFFVPGIWYKTNFETRMAGSLAAHPEDRAFLFREDRLPLPLVMIRTPATGNTVCLIHEDSNPLTFEGESGDRGITDERMQFGSIGVRRESGVSLMFHFPGSEGERTLLGKRSGWALRHHPVKRGIRHEYDLLFSASRSDSYPRAVEESWKKAFQAYQPKIRPVDSGKAYEGLIDTLEHYFSKDGESFDAPGFPFSVYLPDGKVRDYNYQMGFIGRQLPNAWYLVRQGLMAKQDGLLAKGESIIDFWAVNCLTETGLPRTWYDPARNGNKGSWRGSDNPRGGTAMRVATSGMEGMLTAWSAMNAAGREKQTWLACCRKFGDWLVAAQNEDGSYFLAYRHEAEHGENPPTESGKSTTTNPVRYLAMLHRATGDARYRDAALKAGEYAFQHVHRAYHYVGSVVDNPKVIDRESGQEATYAFLALHDLTGEPRWLEAAVQAARYTETWMYCHEIPGESGKTKSDFPADRSIVGQTLIATGHSGADLGLAFSSFDYYRLYLFTGDDHFLHVARLLLHNTKQSLNWDGSLYPGKPKGLQLEAFTVTVPRRKGVMECLSWNYAAHLDPMTRFQDTFGSMDIDAIEKLPLKKRRKMNRNILKTDLR